MASPDPGQKDVVTQVEAGLIASVLGRRPAGMILDIGCGRGRIYRELHPRPEQYVGVDLDRDLLGMSRRLAGGDREHLVQGTALRLPFRSDLFGTALLIRAYHRILDPTRALAEVWRVLRPGGSLILQVTPKGSTSVRWQQCWQSMDGGPSTRDAVRPQTRGIGRTGPYPSQQEPLSQTVDRLSRAGFVLTGQMGSGLEELPLLDALPARFWIRIGLGRSPSTLFPHGYFVATKP